MFSASQYELLDFGSGRKLERFGNAVVDRISPPATGKVPAAKHLWRGADARFEADPPRRGGGGQEEKALGHRGKWIPLTPRGERIAQGEPWTVSHESPRFSLVLKASPFGHLGVFPEQTGNWTAIGAVCREGAARLGRPLRVMNLFAYTGGSTLAAAGEGAETTHLDAAQNVVRQARGNAAASGMEKLPLRWIADDAVKFVKREQKRGRRYDGIVLDPPTYGHGARGEVWRLARDLPGLLDTLVDIMDGDFPFLLLSCHSPGFDAHRLAGMLMERAGRICPEAPGELKATCGPMRIPSTSGGWLDAGCSAMVRRWCE